MAVIGNSVLTLTDWASRVDPDGKTAVIAELLNDGETLLDDILWAEANGIQKHTGTVRTGLPEVYFSAINQGVPASKSTTAQIEEVMAHIESRSSVATRLLRINGNDPAFRMSEDRAFIEAMKQKMLASIIYGNPKKNPECFTGLHLRYNDRRAQTSNMVINADSAASGNTYGSIYLVTWGQNTCHGLFPKGSKIGLEQKDLGEGDALDANGNPYRALQTLFTWDAGLHVKNWESCGRIANISLAKMASGDIKLGNLLIELTERVEEMSSGKPVIYCPKSVRTQLRLQIKNDSNTNLTWDTYEGKRILAFDGIPIKALKAMSFNESAY